MASSGMFSILLFLQGELKWNLGDLREVLNEQVWPESCCCAFQHFAFQQLKRKKRRRPIVQHCLLIHLTKQTGAKRERERERRQSWSLATCCCCYATLLLFSGAPFPILSSAFFSSLEGAKEDNNFHDSFR